MIRYWCGHTIEDARTLQYPVVCARCWADQRDHQPADTLPQPLVMSDELHAFMRRERFRHFRGNGFTGDDMEICARGSEVIGWDHAVVACWRLAQTTPSLSELLHHLARLHSPMPRADVY